MQDRSYLSLAASVVAGLGASVCCVLPLVLVMAGLGGSWLASLKALEPFRPIFVAVAMFALFFASRGIFRAAEVCVPGQACADPRVQAPASTDGKRIHAADRIQADGVWSVQLQAMARRVREKRRVVPVPTSPADGCVRAER